MAIENIQYKYDHTLLYRRALKPVNNQFLSGYIKNNKERQKNEIQLKIARKRCRSLKTIFGPSKYVQLSLLRTTKMWCRSSH